MISYDEDVKDSKDVQEAFENLLNEIDVENKGYALSLLVILKTIKSPIENWRKC